MLGKKIEIARKSVDLIREFFSLEAILGENLCRGIEINKETASIIINDLYEGVLEYDVEKAAIAFEERINGWGPCSSGFYDAIEEEKNRFADKFSELSKDEFINYVGSIYYTEYRCEEIVKELKELAKEYKKL
ncbi:hypothetical protein [Clostridium saudiense]|nr:hypothetical protein [Clostridium saudiense]